MGQGLQLFNGLNVLTVCTLQLSSMNQDWVDMLCGKIECIGVFAMAWLAMCLHGDAPGHTHCHTLPPMFATACHHDTIDTLWHETCPVCVHSIFIHLFRTDFIFLHDNNRHDELCQKPLLFIFYLYIWYEEILKTLREDNRMYLHCNKVARNFLSTICLDILRFGAKTMPHIMRKQ